HLAANVYFGLRRKLHHRQGFGRELTHEGYRQCKVLAPCRIRQAPLRVHAEHRWEALCRSLLCEFFWRHSAPFAARPIRRTDFASPVLADAPAFDVVEIRAGPPQTWRQLERIGRGSGGEYQADAQRSRVSLMNRGKRQEGAQHRGDAGYSNSITSSAHSEFPSPRCLPGLRTSLGLITVLNR